MPLLTIHDPQEILTQARDGPQCLPLVRLPGDGTYRWLLKLGAYGCCEVLGYQLARRLGIPVMPAVPVWCPSAFCEHGQRAGSGRIGLAIQYDETFEDLTWEQSAKMSPGIVSAALLLCLLSRDEWGDFAATKHGLVIYDLEQYFACWCSERLNNETWDEVEHQLNDLTKDFLAKDLLDIRLHDVLKQAKKLGLNEELRLVVEHVSSISTIELATVFDIEPHPLAKQIVNAASEIVTTQFTLAAQHFAS